MEKPEENRDGRGPVVVDHPDPASDDARALVATLAAIGYDAEFGPIVACATCKLFDCACGVREHDPLCRARLAAMCPVGVECEHGYDLCPKCDACSCTEGDR